MPEARDRLGRSEEFPEAYSPRRPSIGRGNSSGTGGGLGVVIEILADEPEEVIATRTPFRWGSAAMSGTRGAVETAAALSGHGGGARRIFGTPGGGGGAFGTPRNVRGRSLNGSPATAIGSQNVFPGSGRGRARGRGSVLPSWYPRTPLRDITAVVRAIERGRARLGERAGQMAGSPIPMDQTVRDPSVSTSGALLEHDMSVITPKSIIGRKPLPLSVTKVPKILLDITNQNNEESGFLTPQKKLLNSIDAVEKVVMEELRKLKRTPTAKKAEREKRVRTLMSMR